MKLLSLALLLFAFGVQTAQSAERPGKSEFKGMELYSWTDSKGKWLFALLTGTNRLKSAKEIKDRKNHILGIDALKKRFAQLAKGESVAWTRHQFIAGFAYPDKRTIEAVQLAAKAAEVQLDLPPTNKG